MTLYEKSKINNLLNVFLSHKPSLAPKFILQAANTNLKSHRTKKTYRKIKLIKLEKFACFILYL